MTSLRALGWAAMIMGGFATGFTLGPVLLGQAGAAEWATFGVGMAGMAGGYVALWINGSREEAAREAWR